LPGLSGRGQRLLVVGQTAADEGGLAEAVGDGHAAQGVFGPGGVGLDEDDGLASVLDEGAGGHLDDLVGQGQFDGAGDELPRR
jgi:hypothetical protein